MNRIVLSLAFLLAGHFAAFSQSFNLVDTHAGSGSQGLVDGPLATAEFYSLYDVAQDPATGDLYVADAFNNAIRKISNGVVSTLAGNGTIGDVNAQGSSARFYYPSGVYYYGGYVYVSDNGNNKIKKIDASGNVTTVAGSTPGYANGTTTTAKFYYPTSIVVNSAGIIYVADYGNHCIREINGNTVTTFAGTGTVSGDVLGAASSALFNRPTDMCFDGAGNMYVTDQVNNKIKMVSNGQVTLLAGSGSQTSVDGTGAGASFYKPSYIGIDYFHNSMFVTEWYTNKVRRIDLSGVVTTIAGTGSSGQTDGPIANATFNSPYGMCVSAGGNLYIGDKLNNVVRVIYAMDVAVSEIQRASALSIFPNPATSSCTIQNDDANPASMISIYDIQGVLVKQIKSVFTKGNIEIDIAELASGTYMIEAVLSDGKKSVGRVIKN